MDSNSLYAICTVLLPRLSDEGCNHRERGRLRAVCSSWARAVDELWGHKQQLNMSTLALDELIDDERQVSMASYLAKNCKRVKELIVSSEDDPNGACTIAPDFWSALQPLAPRLSSLVVENVSLRASGRFFVDFLAHCSRLESLTYRPACAYGWTDFDDDEKNGDILRAFEALKKLKHLRLTIDYFQSAGGRFLASFAGARSLETFDVRHFKLSYYRSFDSDHVTEAIRGRSGVLRTFRTSSYLNVRMLEALTPPNLKSQLHEMEFILEGRSLTFDQDVEMVRSSFARMKDLRVLRVRTSGCLFVDAGAPFDPKLLFAILDSCPSELSTFDFDHVHALMRKRTDRYAGEFARALDRFSATLHELRLNVARVSELNALPWRNMVELRSLCLDECNLIDYSFLSSLIGLRKLILKPTSVTRTLLRSLAKHSPPKLEELLICCRDFVGEDGYERPPSRDEWSLVFKGSRALRSVILVQVDAAVARHNYVKNMTEWARGAFPGIRFTYKRQNGALMDRHL